jgi:hypothetical protein
MSLDKSLQQNCLESIILSYVKATGLKFKDIRSVFLVVENHLYEKEKEQ